MQDRRLIIFDFDGVLADTEDLHCDALVATLSAEGLELTRRDYYRTYLGLPDRDSLRTAFAASGRALAPAAVETLLARKRAEYARRAPAARLYPRAAETLRALHERHVLAVASGAFRDEIEPVLERAGVLSLFAAVVGADDVRSGKPSPEPFLRALEWVNQAAAVELQAGDSLVVEDAPNGIAAAHAAGMRCVAVATSHGRDELGSADAVIDSLPDLLRLVEAS